MNKINPEDFVLFQFESLNVDFIVFDLTNLDRNQILKLAYYFQTSGSFLKNSCTKINSKVDDRKAEVAKEVSRVRKRSSSNYFRVYSKSNGKFIRFELELKKSAIKKFQPYFFLDQFEKWEKLLTYHFYKEAMNKLDLNSPYTDWL